MRGFGQRSCSGRLRRSVGLGLLLSAILLGATGLSCDDDAAAVFREEATSAIGAGVKTIVNGILDGLIAAVEAAGDGGSSTSTSTSTSSG